LSEVLQNGPLDVVIVSGKAAVAAMAPLLEQVALACSQPSAMGWISYFLNVPEKALKVPYLVLVTNGTVEGRTLRVTDLRAAVLMLEYCVAGIPTGVYSTDDSSALRTVIALAHERAEMASLAAQALIRQGAHVVLCTYDEALESAELPAPRLAAGSANSGSLLWARRSRPVARTLRLADTYDATLATLGKSTRFNLRYYRRRLLAAMDCTFVPDVRGQLSEADLRAINAACLNPVPFDLFKLQYASACELPGGFLIGLRGPQGEWLSLIGGWRQADTTVLHWQTNASGYERSSIGTVMRSFFIESEVERGTRWLSFYGGTPHSMQHSFVPHVATDLVVRRRSLRASVLIALARLVVAHQRRTRRVNFVLETLSALSREWRHLSRARPRPIRTPPVPLPILPTQRILTAVSAAESSRR